MVKGHIFLQSGLKAVASSQYGHFRHLCWNTFNTPRHAYCVTHHEISRSRTGANLPQTVSITAWVKRRSLTSSKWITQNPRRCEPSRPSISSSLQPVQPPTCWMRAAGALTQRRSYRRYLTPDHHEDDSCGNEIKSLSLVQWLWHKLCNVSFLRTWRLLNENANVFGNSWNKFSFHIRT